MRLPLAKMFATAFPADRAHLRSADREKLVRASDILKLWELEAIEECEFRVHNVGPYSDSSRPLIELTIVSVYGGDATLAWQGRKDESRVMMFAVPDELLFPFAEHIALEQTEWIMLGVDIYADGDVAARCRSNKLLSIGRPEQIGTYHGTTPLYVYAFNGRMSL